MLKEMTESLFAETIKRIAEDVWKSEFKSINDMINCSNRGSYSYQKEIVEELCKTIVKALLKDENTKKKFEDAIFKSLHEYLDNLKSR